MDYKSNMSDYKVVALSGWKNIADVTSILRRIIALTGKEAPKLVYVATGGKDREVSTPADVRGAFERLGVKVVSKSVCVTKQSLKQIEDMLSTADIIYCGGGDLKFLMNEWQKSGALELILEAGRRGVVLCGCSTGAMCWCKSGFDDYAKKRQIICNKKFPFVHIRRGFEFVDGTGLIPVGMCPHYETPFWANFDRFAERTTMPFFAMENNTAICMVNGKVEIIKGIPSAKAYYFDNGKGVIKSEIFGNIDKIIQ